MLRVHPGHNAESLRSYLGAEVSFIPFCHFRLIYAVTFCNTVLEIRKPGFYGFLGFLQLGVVGETSNIAQVTLAVHTFAGKKEFFKSAQYFLHFELHCTSKQTNN